MYLQPQKYGQGDKLYKGGLGEVKLHILGTSAAFPGAGGACSGYLVTSGQERVLLDCGPGVVGRLQTVCPLEELTAVMLSHTHADHMMDLFVLAYGLMDRCLSSDPGHHLLRVPSFVPPGAHTHLAEISAALGHAGAHYPPIEDASPGYRELVKLSAAGLDPVLEVLALSEYALDGSFGFGQIEVQTRQMEHGPPAVAFRLKAEERTLVYSGDTAPCQALVEIARGADVFLCEATVLPTDELFFSKGHLTPTQAGRIAREAGVGQLIITHFLPWADRLETQELAAEAFGGEVHLAVEGMEWIV